MISCMPSCSDHPCVCAFVCLRGRCMWNGGLLTETLCCYWNTATYCTEEPRGDTNAAKARAEWFNNASRQFGSFLGRSHRLSLITPLKSLKPFLVLTCKFVSKHQCSNECHFFLAFWIKWFCKQDEVWTALQLGDGQVMSLSEQSALFSIFLAHAVHS